MGQIAGQGDPRTVSTMACTLCTCKQFSQHVWRKKKCNTCFHADHLHEGVSVGADDQVYVHGVLVVNAGGVNTVTSPSNAAAAASPARGSSALLSPSNVSSPAATPRTSVSQQPQQQQASPKQQPQPASQSPKQQPKEPAAAASPPAAAAAAAPPRVLASPSAATPGGRTFKAPGSRSDSVTAKPAAAPAPSAPAATTVDSKTHAPTKPAPAEEKAAPSKSATAAVAPASSPSPVTTSASAPSASPPAPTPVPAPAAVAAGKPAPGSRPGSKPGSRRGSLTKASAASAVGTTVAAGGGGGVAALPGMVAEAKPYVAKALYSHVGQIPEQLSFKRNELLLIDGSMEGWLSATVYADAERRGWIPSNYVERVKEENMAEAVAKNRTTKSSSRRSSGINNANASANLNAVAAPAGGADKQPAASSSASSSAAGLPPAHSTPPRKLSAHAKDTPSSSSTSASSPSTTAAAAPTLPTMSSASRRSSFSAEGGAAAASAAALAAASSYTASSSTGATDTSSAASGSSLLEALYDFTAEFPDQQLSFRAGEQFTLISKEDADWWDVQRVGAAANGHQMLCGAVPGLYMREIPQQGVAKAEATKGTTKDNVAATDAAKIADKPAEKPVASAPSALSVPADSTPRRQSFKAPTRASVSAAASPAAAAAAAAPTPIEPESAASVAAAPIAPTPLANAEPVVAATPHAVASSSSSPSSSAAVAPTDAVVATHRTLYAFTATAEGQLSFDAGAALRLLTKEHEAWWRFSHITSGMQGLVAATYVEEVSAGGVATPSAAVAATASLPRHVALYAFSATADGQVSLAAGDVVSVLDPAVGPGWWLVRNERTSEQGLVPLNYLEPKPSDAAVGETDKKPDDAAAVSAPAASSQSEELGEAVALYDFVATEPTQLSVSAGEVVRVLSKPADAWFVARNKATGKEGSVPENYVRFQPAADAGDAVGGVAAVAPAAASVSDEANGERRLSGSKAPPPLSKEQVAHVETVRRNSLKEAAAAASASSSAAIAAPASAPAAEGEAASNPPGGAAIGTTGAGSGPPSRRSSAGSGGPPPLSKELTEHVKRLSISHAATAAAADDGVAAAKASAASAAVPVAASSGGGATHRAAFALAATTAGQLSFDSGALLRLVSKEHDAWWRFVLVSSGEEGLVPANYVTELTTEEMQSGGADGSGAAAGPAAASAGNAVRHAALYDFSGTAAGQLSVTAGEVVSVLDKTSVAGWWRVRKASGEEGLVPENYMQPTPVDEAGSAAATSSAASSSSAPSLYDVVLLFDYQSAAGVSPPLSLSRGALLSVTDDSLADWLTVRSDASEPAAGAVASAVSGLVPSSYTARVLHRARALYAFAGDDSKGLLSLEPDQRVLVTARSDDGNWLTAWTVGRAPAQTGLVPATYIEQS